jgi:hypothetical protein
MNSLLVDLLIFQSLNDQLLDIFLYFRCAYHIDQQIDSEKASLFHEAGVLQNVLKEDNRRFMGLILGQQFGQEFLALLFNLGVGQYFSDQSRRVIFDLIFNRCSRLYVRAGILITLILDV